MIKAAVSVVLVLALAGCGPDKFGDQCRKDGGEVRTLRTDARVTQCVKDGKVIRTRWSSR